MNKGPDFLTCPPPPPPPVTVSRLSDPEADDQLASLAKALAHPVRVRILRILARRDARMCAEIVDELPLAQSTVSEHLRVLREAGLVCAREEGVRTGYCLETAAVDRLKALLERALPAPAPGFVAPAMPVVSRHAKVHP
jgi:ArsR family transcriptional regulator